MFNFVSDLRKMQDKQSTSENAMIRKGMLGISPLVFFLVLYVGAALLTGTLSKVPIAVMFLFASVYAIVTTPNLPYKEKIKIYCHGAGSPRLTYMIWIFVLAGTFASSAQEMGCIQETVNLILTFLPAQIIYASVFIAGCFISMATGSGMGSIVALCPLAVGVAEGVGGNLSLMCAVVVCGAMFGDNLSFISDTTVLATSSQGCSLKDKFRVNFLIVLPIAVVVLMMFVYQGIGIPMESRPPVELNYWKIVPYVSVIILSVCGVDVMATLFFGTLLCGVMGITMGCFDFGGWLQAVDAGIAVMAPMIAIILLASGMIGVMKYNGGIDFIVSVCRRFIRGRRTAEASIALLTGLVCASTANNTVSILTVSDIVKEISGKYGVDPRKAASLLDTSSCIVQELLPYSTHLLAAASFAGISTISMLPYMYYPLLLTLGVSAAIIFNFPSLKPLKNKS